MENARLHSDGSPAFISRDGWELWYLNGVCVTQEIAEKAWDELNPRLVLTEKNAEVRREIVRKIGVERLCVALDAQCVDKSGDYELLNLDLHDGRIRPYLKMLNPSLTGVWHIEGVHPVCDTVEKAIAWRNGVDVGDMPTVLT